MFFFFFQAEDGIRDDLVTGVQTCALPIFLLLCCDALYRLHPETSTNHDYTTICRLVPHCSVHSTLPVYILHNPANNQPVVEILELSGIFSLRL